MRDVDIKKSIHIFIAAMFNIWLIGLDWILELQEIYAVNM